jgi:hypothetical protein
MCILYCFEINILDTVVLGNIMLYTTLSYNILYSGVSPRKVELICLIAGETTPILSLLVISKIKVTINENLELVNI